MVKVPQYAIVVVQYNSSGLMEFTKDDRDDEQNQNGNDSDGDYPIGSHPSQQSAQLQP